MRTNERLANLGAASMEGDILDRQYNSVKWYWFCEHWSKISPGISNSTNTNQIHFLNKIFILPGLQMKKNIYFKLFFYEWLTNSSLLEMW